MSDNTDTVIDQARRRAAGIPDRAVRAAVERSIEVHGMSLEVKADPDQHDRKDYGTWKFKCDSDASEQPSANKMSRKTTFLVVRIHKNARPQCEDHANVDIDYSRKYTVQVSKRTDSCGNQPHSRAVEFFPQTENNDIG